MAESTSSKREMTESRYGDVQKTGNQSGLDPAPYTEPQLSLAKVVTADGSARAWRVTLGPARRNDGRAILVKQGGGGGGDPIFDRATSQYEAGANVTAQVPPRRTNPIFGLGTPVNGADLEPVFVQVTWGMSVGAPNALIAHWPYQGASIVVEGSFVEVTAGVSVQSSGVSPGGSQGLPPIGGAITLADFPQLSAQVVPADGLASEAQGELSITQNLAVTPFVGPAGNAGFYTDGIANPAMGFAVGVTPFAPGAGGAMAVSTAYNVGPFVSWNAVIKPVTAAGAFNTITRLIINTSNVGGPVFALSDNSEPDGAGGFGLSAGDVAINYYTDGVTGVKTVADFEALINTSQLIHVDTPDVANAAKKVNAGFTLLPTHVPSIGPLFGTSVTVAPTQGCAVFVPDFARRVQVSLAQLDARFFGNEYRVPINGPLPAQLVWYDDSGNVVWTEFQGRTVNEDTSAYGGTTEPTVWRPVPAQAVMLGIYSSFVNVQAFVHWRLAP